MPQDCPRPDPEVFQPRVTRWGHTWRVLVMLSISAIGWLPVADHQSEPVFVLDVGLGLASLVAVFSRRRWPVAVAVLVSLATLGSGLASGPAVLAQVSLATRRRWREVALVGSVGFAAAQFFVSWQPGSTNDPFWLDLSINAIISGAIIAWGLYIGSRRELIWTLKNRAERAETEQELRVAQARAGEQARIAREMHDVLAHRISQISMHAGALAFREDLSPQEMREGAGMIRATAHEALTDLRGVLGVLRDSDGELALAPQPTYCDLVQLVEEARSTGLNVSYLDEVTAPAQVPEAAGRTLFRIVQEGITNARKHAPSSLLSIELSGSPEAGLDVVMTNPLGFGTSTPGARLGLVGLSERAELRGGRLEHRRDGSAFVLHGWIPWAA